jgi:hypothetical protein
MAGTAAGLKEQYDRLKKVLKQLVQPAKQKTFPQPALQPIRNQRRF